MSSPAPLPFAGHRVVITRAREQAASLVRLLAEAGAEVATLPLLEIVPPADDRPLRDAAARLAEHPWVAFTSANAVRAMARVAPLPWPAGVRVAVVGQATAATAEELGLPPDLVASGPGGEALARELLAAAPGFGTILLPGAREARPELALALRDAGVAVEEVVAYDVRRPPEAAHRFAALFPLGAPWGWVTFTSPRTVRELAALAGSRWAAERATVAAAAIGPTTAAALLAAGVLPAAQAAQATAAGLVAAMLRAVEARGGAPA